MIFQPPPPFDLPDIALVCGRFSALAKLGIDPHIALGGMLVLYSGLDQNGLATAIASSVAGTASLGIEREAERAKMALRAGLCDFVVNGLDEALRILKNEIRRKRAVSVVVTGDARILMEEIVTRGVQPDILGFAVPELLSRGARMPLFDKASEGIAVTWWAIEPFRWLPAMDALAVASLVVADERIRWIKESPRYLGRAFAGQRFLRMSAMEADIFEAAIRSAVLSGALPQGAYIVRNGEKIGFPL